MSGRDEDMVLPLAKPCRQCRRRTRGVPGRQEAAEAAEQADTAFPSPQRVSLIYINKVPAYVLRLIYIFG